MLFRSDLQKAEGEYRIIENEQADAIKQFNEFNLTVSRQQSKIQSLRQELDFKNTQLGDLQTQMSDSENQLAEATASLSQSSESLQLIEQGLHELMVKKEKDEQQLNVADQAYYNFRNELAEKESAIRHLSKDKEQVE